MIVKKLTVANFRGFRQAEFEFSPGVNLIAGVNGTGKSSIISALRIVCSLQLTMGYTKFGSHLEFAPGDIRIGEEAIDVVATFKRPKDDFEVASEIHHTNDSYVEGAEGEVRSQTRETPNYYRNRILDGSGPGLYATTTPPVVFALFFSPQRSVVNNVTKSTRARLGPEYANFGALDDRGMDIREMANWWLGQIVFAEEQKFGVHVARTMALGQALRGFVPEFDRVSPVSISKGWKINPRNKQGAKIEVFESTLEIIKKGTPLYATQLSDGERGMLALVIELARRLVIANPGNPNPVSDGKAIVLIDEIELHLHPQWQAEVIQRLERTFPNCQFIISTHSPLVIQQVKADRVTIIEGDGSVRRPISTYGLPVEEILEVTQETPPAHQSQAAAIMEALDNFDVEKAEQLLAELSMEAETPNQLLSELQTLIGNTRALLDDSSQDEAEA